jgi:hypothetical protein
VQPRDVAGVLAEPAEEVESSAIPKGVQRKVRKMAGCFSEHERRPW